MDRFHERNGQNSALIDEEEMDKLPVRYGPNSEKNCTNFPYIKHENSQMRQITGKKWTNQRKTWTDFHKDVDRLAKDASKRRKTYESGNRGPGK